MSCRETSFSSFSVSNTCRALLCASLLMQPLFSQVATMSQHLIFKLGLSHGSSDLTAVLRVSVLVCFAVAGSHFSSLLAPQFGGVLGAHFSCAFEVLGYWQSKLNELPRNFFFVFVSLKHLSCASVCFKSTLSAFAC